MAKKADKGAEEDGGNGGKSGGKLKLILMVLPTVLLIVVVVYFLFFKQSSSTTPAATATPATAATATPKAGEAPVPVAVPVTSSTWVAGAVVTAEPITINLANGHFLKLGLALQATADAEETPTPAKALDAAITEFSGKTVDELSTAEGRDKAKEELLKLVMTRYENKIFEINFTTFVMQ